MSLTEVCALLTVVIGLLTLLVTVAKASFDAGWKISHEHDTKDKKIDCPQLPTLTVNLFDTRNGS